MSVVGYKTGEMIFEWFSVALELKDITDAAQLLLLEKSVLSSK